MFPKELCGKLEHYCAGLERACKVAGIPCPEATASSRPDDILLWQEMEGEVCLTSLREALHRRAEHLDFDAIRALLDDLDPPLKWRDREAIDVELEALASQKVQSSKTNTIGIIVPVIRGERPLSEIDEERLGDEFTANFIRKLKKGEFTITKQRPASEDMDPSERVGRATDANTGVNAEGHLVPNGGSATTGTKKTPSSSPEKVSLPCLDRTTDLESTKLLDEQPAINADGTSITPQVPEVQPTFSIGTNTPAARYDVEADDVPDPVGGGRVDTPSVTPEAHDTRLRRTVMNLLTAQCSDALYWLMRSVTIPAIPVWLAELLHLGTRLQPGFKSSQMRIKELIEEDEDGTRINDLSDDLSMLLAASLIRPALMMPSPNYVYLLAHLKETLRPYKCFQLMEKLGEFAARGSALDDVLFKNLSLNAQHHNHQKELERRTRDMLDAMSNKKTNFQRATAVRKELFSIRGKLGAPLHACLEGDYTSLANSLAIHWDDRVLKGEVNELDERVNRSRSRIYDIDYKALDTIKRDAASAYQLLSEWNALNTQPAQTATDYSHRQLSEIANAAFPQLLPNQPYAYFLRTQLKELQSLFVTSSARTPALDPLQELALWPVRLPNAQPVATGFAISESDLLDFLGDARDISLDDLKQSLVKHIKQGHFVLVERYFKAFPESKTQELVATLDEERKKYADSLEELKDKVMSEIVDAYLRGVIQERQELDLNHEIADIINRHDNEAEDVGQTAARLEAMRQQLVEQEEQQKNNLLTRLDEVEKDIQPEHAESIRDLAARGECRAAYDTLAYALAGSFSSQPRKGLGETAHAADNFFQTLREERIKELGPPQSSRPDEVSAWRDLSSKLPDLFRADKGQQSQQVGQLTELLRWLGFSLEQGVQQKEIHREGSPCFWRVVQYDMTISSPLPLWGSGANKRHILIMGRPPSPDYLSNLLGTLFNDKQKGVSKSQPITVLWFGKLSYTQRMSLIQQGRNQNQRYLPLVIDANLFYWLHGLEVGPRTEALFSIAMAGSPYNPYTPDAAGAVPREMFFGRKKVMEDLWDPFGPCIVYGGRQLGKSALLLQVKERHHNIKNGHYVLLHSMLGTTSTLVNVAINELRAVGILDSRVTENTFSAKVKSFLGEDQNRRILLLFDECDAILEQESTKKDFPGLTIFRNLMAETQRRFKVVLTGLHSVQRFSRISNSPLPHFGEPFCVGPLQPDAAYDLVQRPMESLGLRFEKAMLVNTILAHTNYHPSLIQLFCAELVKSRGERSDTTAQPASFISKEIIAQVYKKTDLRKQMRDRFEWTLDLDKRYRVIGYTLALEELTEPGLGMRIPELLEELRKIWPAAFKDAEQAEVESLLEEMVGLGILSPVGVMYRLRTPNIIELLGGEEKIQDQLGQFFQRGYTPPTQLGDARFVLRHEQVTAPSPLTLGQYNVIYARQTGLVLVVGSAALGLERVSETLQFGSIPEDGITMGPGKGFTSQEILSHLRRSNESCRTGGLIAWKDSQEIADTATALTEIHNWLGKLRNDRKFVKFVCLVEATHYFMEVWPQLKDAGILNSGATQVFFLHRWTQSSLEDWFHSSLPPPERVEDIMRITGGWDGLVMARLSGNGLPSLSKSGYAFPDLPAVKEVVDVFHNYGEPVPITQCWELMQPTSQTQEQVRDLLDMLVDLGVLLRIGAGFLSLEPCLAGSLDQEKIA